MTEQFDPTLATIEVTLQHDPLLAIDQIIQRTQKVEDPFAEQEIIIDLTLQAILHIEGHMCPEDHNLRDFTRMFLDDPSRLREKKRISACFLRLLPERGVRWLLDNPWRPRVIGLLDSDIYSIFKIDEKLMAHEKMGPLSERVKNCEKKLRLALQALTSLELMSRHRQKTMNALNDKMGRFLIRPFLAGDIEARLGELYTRVENYIDQRESLGVVDAHERAIEGIQQFIEYTASRGTIYSFWLSELIGQKLLTLVEQDFASNKAAQPARLTIRAREKKYPFHLVNQSVSLGFVVNNEGPGYAHYTNLMMVAGNNIALLEEEIDLRRLAPSTEQNIEIPIKVRQVAQEAEILIQANWQNFDGIQHVEEFIFTAQAQQSDIDWNELAQTDPYSLEPVTTEQELVGRQDVLNRLIATSGAPSVGSSVIHGQKRVGKTSIAKTLQSHLEELGYMVVFLEGGDYVEPSARATVAGMGTMLSRRIIQLDQRIARFDSPVFDEALSPLAKLLDQVTEVVPKRRLIIILDEFDELPANLYARGPLGDAFFLTLRSISSRQNVGFVIVGGEKMRNIMDSQGDQLNKWNVISVDYFSRETDWTNYRELVQRPVVGKLEYTEDALITLHEFTAGNPYFTKLICQHIFRTAIERRDCHITQPEVIAAVKTTVSEAKSNTFQHFWEDGIIETGDHGKEKSVRRRKTLIAVSDTLQKQTPAPKRLIAEHRLVRDIPSLESELREFGSRQILIGDINDGVYNFKVRLFHEWLKTRGVQNVITEFADMDAALQARQQEEELKVKSGEIVALAKKWGPYRGQTISEDKIRAWLDQFATIKEQRAMFSLLAHLRFYSNDFVRHKMAEAHNIAQRGLARHLEHRKVKRSDILVSYLDNPSKSGARFARLYADEAEVYVDNIVEKGQLVEALQRDGIQALVFIDDFACTGNSVTEYLRELDDQLAEIVLERQIKVVFVAVVAFKQGWQHIEQFVNALEMPVIPHVCELIDDKAQCFSEKSDCFPDDDQREFAKRIATQYGRSLEKKWPLGYGDFGLVVVFERSCPNNSLPILWKETTTWMPLFKRH
jgi:hypothetical protein